MTPYSEYERLLQPTNWQHALSDLEVSVAHV